MSVPVDPDRLAWVVLDAIALGDAAAARKWNVSRRTVERYRERSRNDKDLAAAVAEKKRHEESDLANLRVRFLRRALGVLEAKIQSEGATVYEIAGAVKIVGELHQVAMAVDDERPDSTDPEAAEAEGGSDSAPYAAH